MVQGGANVRPDAGQSTGEVRSTHVAAQDGASVLHAMVLHLVARGRQGVRSFFVGVRERRERGVRC